METPPLPLLLLPFLIAAILHHHSSAIAVTYPKEAHPTKSGYLTVNSTTGSAIFYTYYEAQEPHNITSSTPIIIWLQGGPGCSSMVGDFYELGPWLVNQDLTLKPNPGSWNRIFGLLFLDNPIGTGFSIASSPQEIPRNQDDVAIHLFKAIKNFVALDGSFKNRPIYITGESYAGKYVPAIGHYILKKNSVSSSEDRVNLAGVAIGNGLTDPETQVATYAMNAYNWVLINDKQKTLLEKLQSVAVENVRSGKWREATDARTGVLGTLLTMTGLATLYDFRRLMPYQDDIMATFLNDAEVKKALGVKTTSDFKVCSDAVGEALNDDVMKSTKDMVEFLVEKTKVLLYQGQCDLQDGVVSTMAWVKKMEWEGIGEFLDADRKVWWVQGKLAGYVQKWRSLSHVVVMNAGHPVPHDQPVNSQVMIEDWVLGEKLFANHDEKIQDIGNGFKASH